MERETNQRLLVNGDTTLCQPIYPEAMDDPFIGRSRAMQDVFKAIGRVAAQSVSVLIRGESGTGKELVARAIWQHSRRANRQFMVINCAAMSNALLESELFGHEKGAFTDAYQRRIGKLEACDGGTLFLDEIGDMHPIMQAKLLRVVQERRFARVGGDSLLSVDVRIISATNRDLEALCKCDGFRDDLFHRLNGFSIDVPPLRDRGDDVRLIAACLLHRYNQRLSKCIECISPAAAHLLMEYHWPGNVRELETVLSQAMLNSQGTMIVPEDFPRLQRASTLSSEAAVEVDSHELAEQLPAHRFDTFESFVNALVESNASDIYAQVLEYVERYLLGRVLERVGGNQSAAAKRLGINRGSLRYKLRSLGLSIDNTAKFIRRT
jgi:two-component system nitrogen regulation response regulator GlnG